MKFKRIVAALLAAAAAVTSFGTVSFAAEDEAMKKELTYVKQRIDIPEDLSEFSYYKTNRNYKDQYTFTWQTKEGVTDWKNISVTICGKVITGYSANSSKPYDPNYKYSFGKLSKEQIAKKAEGYIKKLNPTVYESIAVKTDNIRVYLGSDQANVPISRLQNGVPVNGQNGNIIIDKNTGELIDYYFNWIFGAGFGEKEKAISVEAAKESFKREFPIELQYVAYRDYETGEYVPSLIYRRTKGGQIDAFTGELCTFEDSYNKYQNEYDEDVAMDDADEDDDDSNPGTGGGEAPVTFTPEEKKRLEEEDKLIKPAQMLEKMKSDGIFNLPVNVDINYSNTSYYPRYDAYICNMSLYSENGEYISIDEGVTPIPYDEENSANRINVTYFNGSCTFNAETGEIISYYGSPSFKNNSNNTRTFLKTEEETAAILKSAFEKLAGNKASEFRLESFSTTYSNLDKNGNLTGKSVLIRAGYSSPRYVRDIPCGSENAYIKADQSGKISNYNMNYLGLKYPSPKKALTADEAYARYFEQVDYSLLYRCAMHNKEVETALVYEADDYLNVNAFTGNLVYSEGREIARRDNGAAGYTDLEGSKYGKIAEKLALYGITLYDEGNRLNENEIITCVQFARVVNSLGVYNSAYYSDTKEGSKKLTRKEAAKMLTSRKLSQELAGMPELFRNPFSDIKDDDPYLGYMALCNKLGYITAKKGKFSPKATITRGEALKIVYDILS